MALELPRSRFNARQIQIPKANIPLEQIIAVQGQNPLATGIQTAGNVLGQALTKRAELQQQGQQVAQIAKLTGQDAPTDMNGLDPENYLKAIQMKSLLQKQNAEGKKKPLGQPFVGKDGQAYQYYYDEKNEKTTAEPLPQGQPGAKPTPPENKQFIGLDENGNPLIMGTKTGKIAATSAPGGTVLPKNNSQATSQTRSTSEFAKTLLPHIDSMRDLIKQADAKGYIGPGAGRVYGQFLAGKVGSTGDPEADRLLGRLRATDSLMKTGAMKVHFGSRGGANMYDHFSDLLNSGKQSSALLNGSLDGIQEFIQGYADAGKGPGGLPSLPVRQATHRWNPQTGQVEELP